MFRTLAVRLRRVPSDEPPVSWRRRFVSVLRRWKRSIAFAGLIAALLCWVAWPHLSAGAAGLLATWRGHDVEWEHYIPEERRRWAPLPTDAAVWKTPGGSLFVNASSPENPEPLSDALDRLAGMPRVKRLALCHVSVNVADARRYAAVHRGVELSAFGCDFAPGALEAIAERGRFESLYLSGCTLPPGGLHAFADQEELYLLRLWDSEGVGGQCTAFAGHASLKIIYADRTSFNDADLAAVSRGQALQQLELAETAITDAGFEGFRSNPSLTWMRLSNTAVTDATVRRLAERCPNLELLDLSGTRVTDDALPHLARLTSLHSLDLSGTRVTAAAADPVLRWPALLWLGLPWALVEEDPVPLIQRFRAELRGGPQVVFGPVPE